MRILLSIILSCFILSSSVLAAQSFDEKLQFGMEQYKKGHTRVCLSVMKKLLKEDPVNAYAQYYFAIASAKLGEKKQAKEAYERVILLNQNPKLVSYSKMGLKDLGMKPEKVKEIISKKKTIKIDKPTINNEKNEPKASNSGKPTDEEVARAIKVLKKAGVLNVNVGMNPYNPMGTMGQNSEMMQMNMLMGGMSGMSGGSNNKGMDMLPFLMMQQSQQNGEKKNISPELMQVMMNNMMMQGMSSLSLDKNK